MTNKGQLIRRISYMIREGLTAKEITDKTGCERSYPYRVARMRGLYITPGPIQSEVRETILANSDLTVKQMCEQFGFHKTMVYRLAKELGIVLPKYPINPTDETVVARIGRHRPVFRVVRRHRLYGEDVIDLMGVTGVHRSVPAAICEPIEVKA